MAAADDLATLQQYLTEARAAYHRLMTGSGVVTLRDQNGETVTYQQASRAGLAAYIAELERQIAQLSGARNPGGPLMVWM